MKSGDRRMFFLSAAFLACAAMGRGELEPWVQHLSPAELLPFMRRVQMPGGPIAIRTAPSETRPLLSKEILRSPDKPELYRLRAQESELALDFRGAESDWKRYAELSADAATGYLALADFYHRRIRPVDEVAALRQAGQEKDDPLLSTRQQRAWKAYERIVSVAQEDGLPRSAAIESYRAWISRYPAEPFPRQALIGYLSRAREYAQAEQEIERYQKDLGNGSYPVQARAALELERNRPEAALRIYDAAYHPLWPEDILASYFNELSRQGKLREFVGLARTALQSNQADLNAASRLFHYYSASQHNQREARRALIEYRTAKEATHSPWSADELETLSNLFGRIGEIEEEARCYYALYSLPGAGDAQQERALFRLANLLLTHPERPIAFGSADLSMYRDVASMDTSPGFLNGVLSLLMNSQAPREAYASQNGKAQAYFHRSAGAELTNLLEKRFPKSASLAPLRAALISAYSAYGDDESVIREAQAFLGRFPDADERLSVGMVLADALARQNREADEFQLYERLLKELADKAQHVPIGSTAQQRTTPHTEQPALRQDSFSPPFAAGEPVEGGGASEAFAVRSPSYVQVLDRYLARLEAKDQPMGVLRVYRAEIDRNPNDAGLYERLAAYLEQHKLSQATEETYRRALAQFADRSWYAKLARWYLKNQQSDAFEKLSREAIAIFSGAELETYLTSVAGQAIVDPILSRQINLFAHQKFPEDLVFVRNLLSCYQHPQTKDAAAYDRLLREYWFYDADLQRTLFQRLAMSGKLDAQLVEARWILSADGGVANPAAAQFIAEAEIWRSHFEDAARPSKQIADAFPGKKEYTGRASALYRSLAGDQPAFTAVAAKLAEEEYQSDPRDLETLARIGDIYADCNLLSKARPYWNRMPQTLPGNADAALQAATVYWDYYQFGDALRIIGDARKRFESPSLFAYQAGAIYENQRNDRKAVDEYTAGAASDDAARRRLIILATRPRTQDLVDRATARANQSSKAFDLRVEILEAQQRLPELQTLVAAEIAAAQPAASPATVQEIARRHGFDALEIKALQRQIDLTNDPIDKISLTLSLMRLQEAKGQRQAAMQTAQMLYREHPLILGVIRGVVDFYQRNKMPEAASGTLTDAASHAKADFPEQFRFEAARIQTGAGRIEEARTLLDQLLKDQPYRADYLTALADTYLQAKDDAGYEKFAMATVRKLAESNLPVDEKNARLASMRRGLVPVLARLGRFAEAEQQYIEVINRFPEDENLTREAASFAAEHQQMPMLLDFYRKTISQAPRDYRWPIVLARILTVAEDFPAAIDSYEKASVARPDRADIVQARALLEERLLRFDAAARSYTRLYELGYHGSQWMRKAAEMYARLGRKADAVSALQRALIGARSESPDADFEIARILDSWGMREEAVEFAGKGAELMGPDLLAKKAPASTQTYVQIMTEARRYQLVFDRLRVADPPMDFSQIIGPIVRSTYTPEEKQALSAALSAKAAAIPELRWPVLFPLLEASGLAELEAEWLLPAMNAANGTDGRLIALQQSRGAYIELAKELEEWMRLHPKDVNGTVLAQTADAYRTTGNTANEMRVLGSMLANNVLSGASLERYLGLLAVRAPSDLLAVIRTHPDQKVRQMAVQTAINQGPKAFAYQAVSAGGAGKQEVWKRAYTALTGLYYTDNSPQIHAAFASMLDSRPIGERVRNRLSPEQAVVGSKWFYFGDRYGDYLELEKSRAAKDYAAASLEAEPSSVDAYVALGVRCANRGDAKLAQERFQEALQLDPDRGDAHDRIARLDWSAQRRDQALAEWRAAFAAYERIQNRGVRVPDVFWTYVSETIRAIGERKVVAQLQPDMKRVLQGYLQINGGYRASELFTPAMEASLKSGVDLKWVISLADSVDGLPVERLASAGLLTSQQEIELMRYRVQRHESMLSTLSGYELTSQTQSLYQERFALVQALLASGDTAGARNEWNRIPETATRFQYPLEIQLAAAEGTLIKLLQRFREQSDDVPREQLQTAAVSLVQLERKPDAVRVLEFLYERELSRSNWDASNFLGLAEVRLEQHREAEAVAVLKRMILLAPEPFETLLPASDVFSRFGQKAPAADFAALRLKAVPWDNAARLALARLSDQQARIRLLAEVVLDPRATYENRVAAAKMSALVIPSGVEKTELGVLASGSPSPAQARKPGYAKARLASAAAAPAETAFALLSEALAIDPHDSEIRFALLRSALATHRDALALTLEQTTAKPLQEPAWFWEVWESLAGAAERTGDLRQTKLYLDRVVKAAPESRKSIAEAKLKSIEREIARRTENKARQPEIRDVIDQDRVVRPMEKGAAQ